MQTYTVIGLYDNGQAYASHFEAEDPNDAMRAAADDTSGDDELQILGAIVGAHDMTAACNNSGNAACASDLITQEEE